MSIKPIHYQVVVPKTAEVSRIHENELNKQGNLIQQQSQNTIKKSHEDLSRVKGKEEAHKLQVKEKNERNNDEHSQNKKNKKKHEDKSFCGKGGGIDIKI